MLFRDKIGPLPIILGALSTRAWEIKTPTSEVNEITSEVNEIISEVDETTLETNGVLSPTLVARFLTRASLSLIPAFCLHCLHLFSKPLTERDLR